MRILGFEKSPFAKTEITRLFDILPGFMTDGLESLTYQEGNLPAGQYNLRGIDHAQVRSLVLPGEDAKKVLIISPVHASEHEKFFYAARFLPDLLRVLTLHGLADAGEDAVHDLPGEEMSHKTEILSQAFSIKSLDDTQEAWRVALINRFCSRGFSMDQARALCRDVEDVLSELEPELDVPAAAYDLNRWHQAVIKRLARATARDMINSNVEDKHARASWLRSVFPEGQESNLEQSSHPALSVEVTDHLRALLEDGQAHRVASLHGLAQALQDI
ncbi:MAG: hypothetical protein WC750_01190 [Patescibacteria group bacterium]|jgi:hypothetical protein